MEDVISVVDPVLGLLPVLLFEREPNAVFCSTPVGDKVICWLLSQPSVIRLRAEGLLFNTSPNGPPIELSQETGIHCDLSLLLPTPSPILRGERLSLSLMGDEVEDMKSEGGIGIEMESCVLSDCGQSSMNWRSGFWDF